MSRLKVVVAPDEPGTWLRDIIEESDAELVPLAEAEALMWNGQGDPATVGEVLAANPGLAWVQLPFAGVENLVEAGVIDTDRTWTCAKGVFGPVVGEHAVALTLALLRNLPARIGVRVWQPREGGRTVRDCRVAVLGAGGIAETYLAMLAPLKPATRVVRRHPGPVPGADRTVTIDDLDDTLAWADVVLVAWALTPETRGVLDARRLRLIGPEGLVVNVGRGPHIVTDDLVTVLAEGALGGAGLDVTDPEPLPDGHPLFGFRNVIITPHCANTTAMVPGSLGPRLRENLRRYQAGEPLHGLIDLDSGY